jgi:hypothetical protein
VNDPEASVPAEPLVDPARKALDEPHLDAEDLEREIGDSEDWDEASKGGGDPAAQSPGTEYSAFTQPCGFSHTPDPAARKTASITAIFLIASVSGTGAWPRSRTALENTSP